MNWCNKLYNGEVSHRIALCTPRQRHFLVKFFLELVSLSSYQATSHFQFFNLEKWFLTLLCQKRGGTQLDFEKRTSREKFVILQSASISVSPGLIIYSLLSFCLHFSLSLVHFSFLSSLLLSLFWTLQWTFIFSADRKDIWYFWHIHTCAW